VRSRPRECVSIGKVSAPEVPPSPPLDLNSRIERRLWLLQRGTDKAEARICAKFGRREFRVYVNGGLLWSRNYAIDETERFDEDSAAKFAEFVTLGWEVPGEAPKGA